MAGMRRSEVSALRWADVIDSTDGDGILVTVRRSKTNQEGRGERGAVREGRRRARPPDAARRYESRAGRPRGAVVGADGVESRVTAHSGRVLRACRAAELLSAQAVTGGVTAAGGHAEPGAEAPRAVA